tara:strand:+ start:646 stop:1005 length:360 start_codon:yes stop_codon:yes gene_type:complete
MLITPGNKKIKILFYISVFIFLSTISFFERTNIFGKKFFFQLKEIEISGYKKVDYVAMQRKLNSLIGQNLLLTKRRDIEEIINENKLISEYTVIKQYPNKISVKLKEVVLVAKFIKDKK